MIKAEPGNLFKMPQILKIPEVVSNFALQKKIIITFDLP